VEILDYIEQRNATAAQSLFSAIVQSAESLPLMPYLFRLGRVPGTREHVVHPNYIVIYQVGADKGAYEKEPQKEAQQTHWTEKTA
jgi:plasmid stabilization system protein ParE